MQETTHIVLKFDVSDRCVCKYNNVKSRKNSHTLQTLSSVFFSSFISIVIKTRYNEMIRNKKGKNAKSTKKKPIAHDTKSINSCTMIALQRSNWSEIWWNCTFLYSVYFVEFGWPISFSRKWTTPPIRRSFQSVCFTLSSNTNERLRRERERHTLKTVRIKLKRETHTSSVLSVVVVRP